MVRGLQAAGVAATVKHFPGLGDVDQDTHHGLAVVAATARRLDAVELAPFRAAIAAGARLAMSAHVAVPGADRRPDPAGDAVAGRHDRRCCAASSGSTA